MNNYPNNTTNIFNISLKKASEAKQKSSVEAIDIINKYKNIAIYKDRKGSYMVDKISFLTKACYQHSCVDNLKKYKKIETSTVEGCLDYIVFVCLPVQENGNIELSFIEMFAQLELCLGSKYLSTCNSLLIEQQRSRKEKIYVEKTVVKIQNKKVEEKIVSVKQKLVYIPVRVYQNPQIICSCMQCMQSA